MFIHTLLGVHPSGSVLANQNSREKLFLQFFEVRANSGARNV